MLRDKRHELWCKGGYDPESGVNPPLNTKFGVILGPLGVVVGILCLLGSCQTGHLSRSKAKSQLDEVLKQYPFAEEGMIHELLVKVGTESGNCNDTPDYDPVQSSKEDAVLSATGYITIRPVKKHVWDVELTQLGNQSIDGEKYAHTVKADCDEWQVTFMLSNFDHLDVTGIVEDGVHAKVDTAMTFVITPVGLAVRKRASALVFDVDKRVFGEELARKFLDNDMESLLGKDLVNTSPDKDRYIKQESFAFEKYDDGWKVTARAK